MPISRAPALIATRSSFRRTSYALRRARRKRTAVSRLSRSQSRRTLKPDTFMSVSSLPVHGFAFVHSGTPVDRLEPFITRSLPTAGQVPDGAAPPEALDEGVEAEEQDPEREEQPDPRRDADRQEQDHGDRVSGQSDPPRHETGTEPDRRRRDGEDRGHPHRVGVHDDDDDPVSPDFIRRSGPVTGAGEKARRHRGGHEQHPDE